MKISVITVSCRPEGLKIVNKALKRQTFTAYEWIIVMPYGMTEKAMELYCNVPNGNVTVLLDPPTFKDDYWAVYKSYNEAIKNAKGELIISWQDNTFADPDCLEKFWFHYQQEPKTIVSAVGNKYADDTWSVVTWKDPRMRTDEGSYYPCYYNDIEWNLCAISKQAIQDVGGFDEEWGDRYSSVCGLDVLARLNIIGSWDFKLDQTIKSYSLEHGRLKDWDKYLPFGEPWQKRLKEYKKNPILSYLEKA